jgi:hypothetical protein
LLYLLPCHFHSAPTSEETSQVLVPAADPSDTIKSSGANNKKMYDMWYKLLHLFFISAIENLSLS